MDSKQQLRYYEGLWLQIRNADKPVAVVCSKKEAKTIIQGVRKEKSIANVRRKRLDLVAYGQLDSPIAAIPERPGKVRILFSLSYNGDKL